MARRLLVAVLVGALALTLVAVALAARPKKGARFSGFVAVTQGINGFKPPVKFTVSANGKSLTGFQYSTLGCFGAGGFRPGVDYYTQPDAIIKVGTVKVSGAGAFSTSGAVFTRSAHGITVKTTAAVRGTFTSPTEASGTITYSQKDTGQFKSQCGPATLDFTAKG
jgi:hypothetical protein